jgi:hypothetical protein
MGDLNVNLKSKSKQAILLREFLSTFDIAPGDQIASESILCGNSVNYDNNMYTFCNEKRGCFSKIDYICISNSLKGSLKSYCTIDSALNHSDHIPVSLSLNIFPEFNLLRTLSLTKSADANANNVATKSSVTRRLRWEHCDSAGYYDYTRNYLYPIYSDIVRFNDSYIIEQSNLDEIDVENWYASIVDVLQTAANYFVPAVPDNTFKSWWSVDLKNLKSKAMQSHKIWESAGKPKHGPLFDLKTRDKLAYKQEIRQSKNKEDACVSDSLHEALLNKSNNIFWKTWNNKLSKKYKTKIDVDCAGSDFEIATKFASYFQQAGTPNSEHFDTCKREEFNTKFNGYSGDVLTAEQLTISAEAVSIAVEKVNKGKAPGLDGIMIEHVLHCHPIIYTLLAKLFNQILKTGHIPSDFGRGIIIPLPKSENMKGNHKIDSFRGITLSPIFSKIFEHCIMDLLSDYLYTDDHQFGFKANTGCAHAIYITRLVTDYFVQNNSTVNLCCIDVSKAFDKLNQSVLFLKLMKRRVPAIFISVLKNWYDNVEVCVKWNGVLSQTFKVIAGVRQGGILSPVLFLIYVDDMLSKLAKCGCNIGRHLVGALMYADDILLMSPSVHELQTMLTICDTELELLDLKLNALKSACLRIGQRFNKQCFTLQSKFGKIPWVTETRYLGVHITSGSKFKCNFDQVKSKYYRSSNAILGKLGKQRNPAVALQLISSIAVPVLTFGVEALCLSKSEKQSLDHPWNRTFMKIYSTFDNRIIKQCQYYGGFLPTSLSIDLKCCEFLRKIPLTKNTLLCLVTDMLGQSDFQQLAERYKSNVNSFACKYRSIIYKYFDEEIKALFN